MTLYLSWTTNTFSFREQSEKFLKSKNYNRSKLHYNMLAKISTQADEREKILSIFN